MPQDLEYISKVYSALKGELGDSFTKTEDEFINSLNTEEGYSSKVYGALKGELGDSFDKTEDEFASLVIPDKKKVETEAATEVLPSLESPSTLDSESTNVAGKIFQEPEYADNAVMSPKDTKETLDILEFDKSLEKLSEDQKAIFSNVRTKLKDKGLKTPQEYLYLFNKAVEDGEEPVNAALYAGLTPVSEDGKIRYEIPIESQSLFKKEAEFEYKKMLREKSDKKDPFLKSLNDALLVGAGDFVSQTMDVLGFAGLNMIEGYDKLTQEQYDAVESMSQNLPQEQESIIEMAQSGDIGGASGKAALSLARTIPSMITMMAGGQTGLMNMSAGVARAKYRDLKDEDVPELMKVVSSISDGVAEFVFEGAITMPMMNQAKKAFVKMGREEAEKTLKPVFTNELERVISGVWGFTNPAIKEGASEAATQIIQNMGDIAYLGQDKDAMEGVSDAFVVGALMGKGITAPVDAANLGGYLKGKVKKIPEGIDAAKKYVITPLLVKKDEILKNKEKADDAFAPQYKEELAKVDEQIQEEATKKTVDSEQQTEQATGQVAEQDEVLISEDELSQLDVTKETFKEGDIVYTKDGERGEVKKEGSKLVLDTGKRIYEFGEGFEDSLTKTPPQGVEAISKKEFISNGNKYEIISVQRKKDGSHVVKGKRILSEEGGEKKYGTITRLTGEQAEIVAKELSLGEEPSAVETGKVKTKGVEKKPIEEEQEPIKKKKITQKEINETPDEKLNKIIEEEDKAEKEYEQMLLDEAEGKIKEAEHLFVSYDGNDYLVRKKSNGEYVIQDMNGKAVRGDVRSKISAEYDTKLNEVKNQALEDAATEAGKSRKKSEDRILKALDAAIEFTDLRKNKYLKGKALVGIGAVEVPAWVVNGSLKIVRASYIGGKKIVDAVIEGANYLRSQGYNVNQVEYNKYVKENINKPEQNAIQVGKTKEAPVGKQAKGSEGVHKEGKKKSRKQERKDAKKKVIEIKDKYSKQISEANEEDGKKLLRKMFDEVRMAYKPSKLVGESRVKGFASGIKKIDDNFKNIIKKLEGDIEKGVTLNSIVSQYVKAVDNQERTILRNDVKNSLKKKIANPVAKQTMGSASSIIKGIDSDKKLANENRTQRIEDKAKDIKVTNPSLSDTKAKQLATLYVDQEIDNDFNSLASATISKAISDAKRKNIKDTEVIEEIARKYLNGDLDSMAELIDDINSFIESGREAYSERKEARKQERERVTTAATEQISKPINDFLGKFARTDRKNGIPFSKMLSVALKTKGTQSNAFKNLVEKFLEVQMIISNKMPFRSILKTMESINKLLTDEKDGGIYGEMLHTAARAEADRNQLVSEQEHIFIADLARAMGEKVESDPIETRKNVAEKFDRKKKETVQVSFPLEANKQTISRGELWHWYNTLQQDDVRTKMLASGQMTEASINEMESLMEKEDLAIAKAMSGAVDRFGKMEEKWAAENNVPFEMVDNYWPTKVEKYNNAQLEDNGTGYMLPKPESESILKSRVNHQETFDMFGMDAFDVMNRYIMSSARVLTSKEAVDMANSILANQDVIRTLKAFNLYHIYADRLAAALGVSKDRGEKDYKVIGWLTGKTARATLAYKPMQLLKQSTSALAGLEEYAKINEGKSDAKIISGFTKDLRYAVSNIRKIHREMMKKSPEYRLRMENWYRANIDASVNEDTVAGKVNTLIENIGAKGMLPTKYGDAAGILLGYYPVYKSALRNGMTEKEALGLFEHYDRTQQAQLKAHRAAIQDQKIAKVYTMWQSTSIAYLNKVDQAKTELWKTFKETGKIDMRQLYKVIMYRQILNGLFAAVGNLPTLIFGSDDDEELFGTDMPSKYKSFLVNMMRSQALGNANAIPLFADIAGAAYNKLVGINWKSGGTPLLGTVNKFEMELSKAIKEMDNFGGEPANAIADAVLMGTDAVTGAGLYNLKDVTYNGLFKTAEDIIEGDWYGAKGSAGHIFSLPKSQIQKDGF